MNREQMHFCPEQAGGEAAEFERNYYADYQRQRTAKYPTKVLVDLLAAGEINRKQYERLRRESIEHEHEHDAPAAPEQSASWTSVNMTEDPRDPRFTIEEGDKLLATVYDAATAQRIITEHNQHSTLIAQRERLLSAVQKFVNYYDGPNAARLGNGQARRSLDEFRAALTTIEQKGTTRQ